jgi:xanthine dehydrogenase accessory factor
MMSPALSRRAQELAAQGEAFVTATVVHAQPPTSAKAGMAALVLPDGAIEGFVGGACTEHSVRAYSLLALESGDALLLRILPFAEDAGEPGDDVIAGDGTVTVQNPCLSGGAIEVFLEPVLPAPRVLVVGDTPIAQAVIRIGAELGLDAVAVDGDRLEPQAGDLALVVAAHGRDELHTLRRGLEAELPYVGLVASPKRGTGVLAELRGDGVPEGQLAQIDVPAGIDIGARTPEEIALSILARIVAVRRAAGGEAAPTRPALAASGPAAAPGALAIDPICGMTVAAVASTPSLVHEGETVYFCCEGCRAKFAAQHGHASVGD